MRTAISLFFLCILMSRAKAQVVTLPEKGHHSFFPLMQGFKKKAEAAGAEFPKPYGVAASMYYQNQEMSIEKIRLGNLELEPNGVIDFADSKIRNTVVSSQARADVWVLPFVNIYGMAGRVNTFNDIKLQINATAPPGSINPGDVPLFERQQIANINGTVLGFGTVIAGGYGKVFANVNLTWAKTFLRELSSEQKSFVAFPMVGLTTNFANLFVGGIYQNTGQVNKGSFTGSSGQIVEYALNYRSSRWNYAFGLNKSIGNWTVVLIQGVGARVNSVVEVGYRFGN